jgi:hypothetical protein
MARVVYSASLMSTTSSSGPTGRSTDPTARYRTAAPGARFDATVRPVWTGVL